MSNQCSFGEHCINAHSKEELQEWKERITWRLRKEKEKDQNKKHNNYAMELQREIDAHQEPTDIVSK